MSKPNPNYEGRPDVERMLERLRLGMATLEFRSEEGIDTDEELVRQLLAHVDLGYGEAVAAGVRDGTQGEQQVVWDSSLRGETPIKEVAVDPNTSEATTDTLLEEVAMLEVEEE